MNLFVIVNFQILYIIKIINDYVCEFCEVSTAKKSNVINAKRKGKK